jgi:hypothetical protein
MTPGEELLNTIRVPLATLTEDPENARVHPDRNLDVLRASLATFGQRKPIVILRSGRIIAGNGLALAARALGWTEIAAVVFETEDADVARAYALADNRTGELSRWNLAELTDRLKAEAESPTLGLPNLETLGWASYELDVLFSAEFPGAARVAPGGTGALSGDAKVAPLRMTQDQRTVILQAVTRLRAREGLLTDGAAVAWLCRSAATMSIGP